MSLVTAKKIFEDNIFVGPKNVLTTINCDAITNSPKAAWLIVDPSAEVEFNIVTVDPDNASAIKGVLIDQDGRGVLVDGEIDDFIAKCNACCGADSAVTPVYDGTFPAPAAQVAKSYTVQRTDNGTGIAMQDASYAYLRYALPNTFKFSSRNNTTGVSTYKFDAYELPPKQGTDTVALSA